ncbi:MAG: hypothetical protein MJB57_02870 [Gemmatimonadetes bacterium]|nr:hypothetical protein [Gemmatimonadota bacterium]
MIVGVDTGGTFTDLIAIDGSEVRIHKLPSTPNDPSAAVLRGLDELLGETGARAARIIHGSTVATNAPLERKGARRAPSFGQVPPQNLGPAAIVDVAGASSAADHQTRVWARTAWEDRHVTIHDWGDRLSG